MDAKFYIKNLNSSSKQNSEEENENEAFKDIISDIVFDVGTISAGINEIDEETANKLHNSVLIIKSENFSDNLPRTNDYLLTIDNIAQALSSIASSEGVSNMAILCCFGYSMLSIEVLNTFQSANFVFVVEYMVGTTIKYGLVPYEL